ncbi:hypothetical protein [Nonomuraea dietziae]|uniref:hypothetical protein n=1 Tax=Nonomuraea dietziae TaxID=65515 RepID=UPI0031D29EF5
MRCSSRGATALTLADDNYRKSDDDSRYQQTGGIDPSQLGAPGNVGNLGRPGQSRNMGNPDGLG